MAASKTRANASAAKRRLMRNPLRNEPPINLTPTQAEDYEWFTRQATFRLTYEGPSEPNEIDVAEFRDSYELKEPDRILLSFLSAFYAAEKVLTRSKVWLGTKYAAAKNVESTVATLKREANLLAEEEELRSMLTAAPPGSWQSLRAAERLAVMESRLLPVATMMAEHERRRLSGAYLSSDSDQLREHATALETLARPVRPGQEWTEDTWRRCAVLNRLAECLLLEHRLPTKGELREFIDDWIEARDPEGTKVSVISGPQFSRMLKELGLAGLPAQRQGRKVGVVDF